MHSHPIRSSLIMILSGLLLLVTAHAGQSPGPPGLSQFLDDQGFLQVPDKFDGVIDPSGFKLASYQEGAPRFQPFSQGPDVPGEWEGVGALPFGCNGAVLAMVRTDSGDIFLGGQFTQCGDLTVNHIVRYDPVANTFHALDNGIAVGVDEWVWALAASGEDLYAGGSFAHAGGQQVNNLARWDGSQWHALSGSGDTVGVSSRVAALAVAGDDLFIGGSFTQAGGEAANSIVRWDRVQEEWHALTSGDVNGVDSDVFALTVSGDDLYVGGWFGSAGGLESRGVARWDRVEEQWHAIPGLNANVFSLAMLADNLYVGGSFAQAAEQTVNRVARWDGAQWHALAGPDGAGVTDFFGTGTVRSLAIIGGDLYVAGNFTRAGSQNPFAGGVVALGVARWDGSQWHALAEPGGFPGFFGGFAEVGATNLPLVLAMATHGDELFLGGFFSGAGGRAANRVARWNQNTAQWNTVGPDPGGASAPVRAIAVRGSDVFLGGEFTHIGGITANYIVRWDGQQWSPIVVNGQNGMNGMVSSLAVLGNDLYAAGSFSQAGGQIVNRVARWDGSQWHGFTPQNGSPSGVLGSIAALAVDGTALYVAGMLIQAGGQSVNGIARWDGNEWGPLGAGAQNGVDGLVRALALSGNDLYVGGDFTQAGGIAANGIARWDRDQEQWHALLVEQENGVDGVVDAFEVSGSQLYVGGAFTQAGGKTVNNLARWDGSDWHALSASDGSVGVNGRIRILAFEGSLLYAGGSFTQAGGNAINRVGLWDGEDWTSVGTGQENGVDGAVSALAFRDGRILVGGQFFRAGLQGSSGFATFGQGIPDEIFRDRFAPPTVQPGDTFQDCPDCPTMVMIPAGTFTQGSPASEPLSSLWERPQRQVNVPAFALGQNAVTFAEWDACVADGGCTHNPDDAGWGRGDRPVINVSWNDAQQYVTWLSNKTGHDYRLPSESEWEYATRAGTTGRFNTGDCITTDQANFRGTNPAMGCPTGIYREQTLPVGSFAPNAFGLYDTHGNVLEWTQDCWNSNYNNAPTNGSAWMSGDCSLAVLRGGSWFNFGNGLRSANRNGFTRGDRTSSWGFRVARPVTL